MANRVAPNKPELIRQGNGLRVIRYAFKTKRGKVVPRSYKLGWMKEPEAKTLYDQFMAQWAKMNGDGAEGVISAFESKRKHKGGLPAVIDEKAAKATKGFKLSDEQREKARNAYHAKKNGNGGGKPGKASPDISQMKDMVGVMVASLSAVSTSLKMLQDQLERMQH